MLHTYGIRQSDDVHGGWHKCQHFSHIRLWRTQAILTDNSLSVAMHQRVHHWRCEIIWQIKTRNKESSLM